MARINPTLRQSVIRRAAHRCEYCCAPQIMILTMHIDHIIPQAVGGETLLDNLCLACARCNGAKRDFQTGLDPETGQEMPLFHPRQQRWSDHFAWSEDTTLMIGLTATGRVTIHRLKLNELSLQQARAMWKLTGLHPPSESS